jgi:hypothetical protein
MTIAAGRVEIRVVFANGVELSYHADPEVARRYAADAPRAGFRAEVRGEPHPGTRPLPCESLWT